MIFIKEFITDLVFYVRVRMSDLGKGAIIIWDDKRRMIEKIHFKTIEVFDDEVRIFIPIRNWVTVTKYYPIPKKSEFEEK
jgi:hypothetical protein